MALPHLSHREAITRPSAEQRVQSVGRIMSNRWHSYPRDAGELGHYVFMDEASRHTQR